METPKPPNLRPADDGAPERCGACRMFDNGSCWGYGDWPVQPDEVCDSYAPESDSPRGGLMDKHEQRPDSAPETRAKYTADQLADLGVQGQAFKVESGDWAFPTADIEDLRSAIVAASAPDQDQNSVRAYIVSRAKALGASDEIPDTWNSDGTLKDGAGADDPDADGRSQAPPARNHATPKRAFSSLLERPPAHTAELQVRLDDNTDANVAHFAGYASTTGVRYAVTDWLGEYGETMMPGSFTKTLREQGDVPFLFNHDGVPLASTGSGTSRLSEDGTGLRNEAEFDRRDALTNSVCVQLRRGVLSKMSFSFQAMKDTWNDAYDEREVNEARLYDTSIVTYPANDTTSGGLVDAMRSALGREGRSLWLAGDQSMRSVLPALIERREVDEADAVLERALRALVSADEVVSRSHGPHGRARTFLVARSMLELRAGKVLSAANETLLRDALSALAKADRALDGIDSAIDDGQTAISTVLDVANPDTDDDGDDKKAAGAGPDGKGANQGAGNGNPINPQDGAGPRSIPPSVLLARREVERLKRRR